jgi:hypothetical protein
MARAGLLALNFLQCMYFFHKKNNFCLVLPINIKLCAVYFFALYEMVRTQITNGKQIFGKLDEVYPERSTGWSQSPAYICFPYIFHLFGSSEKKYCQIKASVFKIGKLIVKKSCKPDDFLILMR